MKPDPLPSLTAAQKNSRIYSFTLFYSELLYISYIFQSNIYAAIFSNWRFFSAARRSLAIDKKIEKPARATITKNCVAFIPPNQPIEVSQFGAALNLLPGAPDSDCTRAAHAYTSYNTYRRKKFSLHILRTRKICKEKHIHILKCVYTTYTEEGCC